jgi:hypothetical protein
VTHVRLEEFADLHPIEKHTQSIKEWISEQLRMGNAVRSAAQTAKDPDDSMRTKLEAGSSHAEEDGERVSIY